MAYVNGHQLTGTVMDRLLYRIPEAAELLGVKRTTIYALIGAGQLKAVKVGRAARIPADELRRYVERARGAADLATTAAV